jgi:hypothetical protein
MVAVLSRSRAGGLGGQVQVGDGLDRTAGEDGAGVGGDERLGGPVALQVEAPGGFPQVFQDVKSTTIWIFTSRTAASARIWSI